MTIYSKTWELTGDVIQIRTKFEYIIKYYVFCNDTPLNIYFKKSQALEHAELKNKLEHRNCLDCSNHSSNLRMRNLELEKENAEAKNLIEGLASSLSVVGECDEEECKLINKAQKFINKPIF